MGDLDRIRCDLKSGDEKFHSERGDDSALRLLDYWRWAESCLMDNTTRGLLAEFLVAAAIGQHEKPREEWEAYDLETKSGVTIEVKSSAYIQSWPQTAPSRIQFRIARRKKWDSKTRQYQDPIGRWAKVYVFCVLEGAKPLDLDKWKFYVLSRDVLNRECPKHKTIVLNSLLRLPGIQGCRYRDLRRTIEALEDVSDRRAVSG